MKNEKKNELENIYSTRLGCRHLVKISWELSDLPINYAPGTALPSRITWSRY